jgi:acetyl-CoA acyltransferase
VIRDSKLDPSKVNPLGGAIALGHPLGATGAVRTATIVHGLHRRKQKYGLVTMCIGTGMGAAGVFEAV